MPCPSLFLLFILLQLDLSFICSKKAVQNYSGVFKCLIWPFCFFGFVNGLHLVVILLCYFLSSWYTLKVKCLPPAEAFCTLQDVVKGFAFTMESCHVTIHPVQVS